MKKKIFIGSIASLAVLALVGCQQADNTTPTPAADTSSSAQVQVNPSTDTSAAVDASTMTGVTMKDGKMMMMGQGSQTAPMTNDATMSNGTVVMMDGTVKMSDGTTSMLNDGDSMMKDGTLNRATTDDSASGSVTNVPTGETPAAPSDSTSN